MNFSLFSLPFGFVDSMFFFSFGNGYERAKIQAAPWPDRDGKGGVVLLGDQSFCSSDTLRSMGDSSFFFSDAGLDLGMKKRLWTSSSGSDLMS
ncbi:hypothetical protein M5K25_007766 [Dendrobium thyrsiflorum]|uniref:Uncharacterized protein n=1 Tax=Dendrobium thyrsiflorum TaxID=117978 RepID=A0ABD0VF89_DENTH